MWLVSWMATALSMILEIRHRFDTGQKLENWLWSASGFFKQGDTTAVLRDFTIVAVDSDMLIIFLIVGSSTLKQYLKTVDGIGSKQHDFAEGFLANATIWSSVTSSNTQSFWVLSRRIQCRRSTDLIFSKGERLMDLLNLFCKIVSKWVGQCCVVTRGRISPNSWLL